MMTDLRNILPRAKIYGVQSQNAITLRGTPEDLETAHKLIADLDRPRPLYRLTYTITGYDGGKSTGSQSFDPGGTGQRSIFKQGNRVPIVTGSYDTQARNSNTQVQYQDMGLEHSRNGRRVSGWPDFAHQDRAMESSRRPICNCRTGPCSSPNRSTGGGRNLSGQANCPRIARCSRHNTAPGDRGNCRVGSLTLSKPGILRDARGAAHRWHDCARRFRIWPLECRKSASHYRARSIRR